MSFLRLATRFRTSSLLTSSSFTPSLLPITSTFSFSSDSTDREFTALITGANRGLGLEFTKQLLDKNYRVIGCCRKPSNELESLPTKHPNGLAIFAMDVNYEEHIQALKDDCKDIPIDLCILNAGIIGEKSFSGRFGNMKYDDLMHVFSTNVCGSILVAQALYENVLMSKRKQFVCISTGMSSITNLQNDNALPYRISKAAFNMAMQGIKYKSINDNNEIHTLLLTPGWVKTDMGTQNAMLTPEKSITNMLKVIDNYQNLKNGGLYSHEGEELPW